MVVDTVVLEQLLNAVQKSLQERFMQLRIGRLLVNDDMLEISISGALINGSDVLHNLRIIKVQLASLRQKELFSVSGSSYPKLTFSPFSGSRLISHSV